MLQKKFELNEDWMNEFFFWYMFYIINIRII
jgi:hypothetical protein